MRRPKPSYRMQLAAEQAHQLRQLVRARTPPQTTSFRARIVLAAHDHPAWSNQQIAQHLGTADRIARKWRRRWTETQLLADAPRPQARRGVVPPELCPQARPRPVACPARRMCRSPAGVGPNWHGAWPLLVPRPRSRPVRLGAGASKTNFDPGVIACGTTWTTRPPFWSGRGRSCAWMRTHARCCRAGHGECVSMSKPRSRRAKLHKLLDRPQRATAPASRRATNGAALAT